MGSISALCWRIPFAFLIVSNIPLITEISFFPSRLRMPRKKFRFEIILFRADNSSELNFASNSAKNKNRNILSEISYLYLQKAFFKQRPDDLQMNHKFNNEKDSIFIK